MIRKSSARAVFVSDPRLRAVRRQATLRPAGYVPLCPEHSGCGGAAPNHPPTKATVKSASPPQGGGEGGYAGRLRGFWNCEYPSSPALSLPWPSPIVEWPSWAGLL
jgi:hypothetical protein